MSNLEFRSGYEPISVRDNAATCGKGVQLAGYAARFGVESFDLGGFTETIRSGAFAKALASPEYDTVALRDHNPSDIFGRRSAGTLQLWQDENGLAFCVQMPDTQLARDLCCLIARRDIQSCSYGFGDVQDSWSYTDGKRLRTIRSIGALSDISIVTNPAYPRTSVSVGTNKPFARSVGRLGLSSLDADRIRLLEVVCRH